ncbi:sensor histidine kinase [Streptomyces sp. WZ-12]|uniref:sensor histidine kinase n=1 Tax=Streptomyces sp. WZ-12 TaxID=3030210 RepID=UPI0023818261|nr:histidine kinase [Streptomyces sp. WZ-12]
MAARPTRLLPDTGWFSGRAQHRRALDVTLAVLVAGISCALIQAADGSGLAGDRTIGCLYAVGAAATLVVRRRHPGLCVAAALLAALAAAEQTPLIIAAYSLGQHGGRRRHFVVAGAAVGYLAVQVLSRTSGATTQETEHVLAGYLLLPVLMGELIRRERQLQILLRERLDRAERAVGHAERCARLEERARLAHDIHDNVGHQASVLALHAGALSRMPDLPPKAHETADRIAGTASAMMRELRATIRILGEPEAVEEAAGRRPVPAADFLPRLVRNMSATGMTVSYRLEGDRRELPPAADQLLCRVSREAMTNAAKHAPGAEARVTLAFAVASVALSVENGPAAAASAVPDSGRLGLRGLREAVTRAGGQLETRALPNGGFRLHAVLACPRNSKAPRRPTARRGPVPNR